MVTGHLWALQMEPVVIPGRTRGEAESNCHFVGFFQISLFEKCEKEMNLMHVMNGVRTGSDSPLCRSYALYTCRRCDRRAAVRK